MAPGRSHATAAQPAPAIAFLSAREDANYDLYVLRDVAQLPSSGCVLAGNVKCDDGLAATDSLFILRFVAQLPVNLPTGCPEIGV